MQNENSLNVNFLQKRQIVFKKICDSLLLVAFFTLITGLVLYKVVFITNMSLVPSFWTIYGIIATIFLVSRIPLSYLYGDDHGKVYPDSEYPNVSVIIAAKNEEKGIFKTISTCIESQYPGKIECTVIDDGSTDGTKEMVKKAQETYGDRVKLIAFSENKGKREAMATGINAAQYEIIVFVDSDSFLAPDAIHHIVEHFLADEKIGAVSGNTKVKNANANLLTRMQSIQYAVSFDMYKASESFYSSVTCCPGCFSAYRKEAIKPLVEEWKGQKFLGTKGTFGDDRGLTNFVLKSGWDIVYCEKARASTVVPEKFSIYWKQQLRWKKSWIREGVFASLFMWRRSHPLASFGFYTNFTFPILGPILAANVLINSFRSNNALLFIVFMSGFILLGTVFALFIRVSRGAENWYLMPLFSILFVSALIWQMPYALLTLRNTRWGTR